MGLILPPETGLLAEGRAYFTRQRTENRQMALPRNWVPSCTNLPRHPKFLKLCSLLECSVVEGLGYLHLLWYFAFEYSDDGSIAGFDYRQVESACTWDARDGHLYNTFKQCGFIDETGRVHDWEDYVGHILRRRASNAARMRAARAVHVEGYRPDRPDPTDHTGPSGLVSVTTPPPPKPDPWSDSEVRKAQAMLASKRAEIRRNEPRPEQEDL